jgi:gliding motility-associated-like protein
MSPNGDGVNDFFVIENVELYFNYGLYFYNDNGNLVFEFTDTGYDNSWNGISQNGKELSSATYYYYFINKENDQEFFKGKVFIERADKY